MGKADRNTTPANTKRLLVVLPNWVGDVVLATPALRAIREHYRGSHVAYVMRPYVREVLEPCRWCDEVSFWSKSKGKARQQRDFLRLAADLRERRFEAALLLSNSFRAALLARLAGIKVRIGYTRDGRGMLLTVKMMPDRIKGKYVPVSMVRYYGALARYLGCTVDEDRLELPVGQDDRSAADSLLSSLGIRSDQKFIAINPGAAYGWAKCWPAERFAEVADGLAARTGMRSVVVYGPGEQEIAARIVQCARREAALVPPRIVPLGVLKGVLSRGELLVTNDTGPRHFAKAFGKPVVTIFGPTDPRWTQTRYPLERQVRVDVPCGPCMLKRCPLDHRCMQLVTAEAVCGAALDLLRPSTLAAGRQQ
jgi:heptosyltransferase-2